MLIAHRRVIKRHSPLVVTENILIPFPHHHKIPPLCYGALIHGDSLIDADDRLSQVDLFVMWCSLQNIFLSTKALLN